MDTIEQLEKRLWGAADLLRANSNLNSSEYMMPVLGIIFLRHAYSRYLAVKARIEPTLPTRGGVRLPLTKDHFTREAALFLRPEAQFDYLLALPGDQDLGKALNDAMTAIEEDYPAKLKGVLPKDYARLSDDLLRQLLKIFNDEALRRTGEDVLGRINEYFLLKFAMARAQDEGEFFTPPALTQLITYVIEPDHGILWDPAFGAGDMFVQSGHFVEQAGRTPQEAITFYGQEKSTTNLRIGLMNMAVHNLEGQLVEANSFYEDRHNMVGRADFVMANPPFNVDGVDEKVKEDSGRLPFGIPGVNKEKKISNANYLWISYFYNYTLTTDSFVGYLTNRARGGAYPAVLASDFEDAELLGPGRAFVGEFDRLVRPMIDQRANLRLQNEHLRQARDLLLPRLMSGEIEV
jgi:type I restriction enzyme M protein